MKTTSPQLIDEVAALVEEGSTDVFNTMLGLSTQPIDPEYTRNDEEDFVAASAGFVGDIHGIVYIYLRSSFARVVASRLLNIELEEGTDDEVIADAIGELSNMIVGGTKSRLCDLGYLCTLTIPSVVRGKGLRAHAVGGAESQLLGMTCNDEAVLYKIIVKSSNKSSNE